MIERKLEGGIQGEERKSKKRRKGEKEKSVYGKYRKKKAKINYI